MARFSALNSETISYWYFRLNGFLLLKSLIAHPDEGANQRGEFDLVGVRFPFRQELAGSGRPMEDADWIARYVGKPLIVVVEVKSGRTMLHSAVTDRADRSLENLLMLLGTHADSAIDVAAKQLYETGCHSDAQYHMQLVAIGVKTRPGLRNRVLQISCDEIADFIFDRFSGYDLQKRNVGQWDEAGRQMRAVYDLYSTHRQKDEFRDALRHCFYGKQHQA